MSTLCIIDMQYEFLSRKKHKESIPRVVHEVNLVKRRNFPIIILEYDEWGNTVDEIIKSIGEYPYKKGIKFSDGGGYELVDIAKKHNISLNKVRLCGVNRGFCVYATALELQYLKPEIKLSVSVNATWCTDPKNGLRKLSRVCKLLYHGEKIDKTNVKVSLPINDKRVYDYIERDWYEEDHKIKGI